MASDLTKVIRAAEREGWEVSATRGGHVRFRKAGSPLVITSSTPGDARATRNLIARLRRGGLVGLRRGGA